MYKYDSRRAAKEEHIQAKSKGIARDVEDGDTHGGALFDLP
jgi:hypothetical protein